ncbi:transcription factor GAMYB-like [Cicer arietinum]|uniref:transcription factor GAMYB-like n=1 Tax=Cicer arietinum TaxID=3827 RepID=UPI003CC56EC8
MKYWNTRVKRCQRAGLPVYPPGVQQETPRDQSTGGINGDHKLHPDDIHDAIFDSLKDNQGILPYVPELCDISAYGNMLNGFDSYQYCSFLPATSFSGNNNISGFYPFDHIQDNTSDNLTQSFGMQSPLDPGLSSHSSMCYSHSLKNGNSSASKPFEAVKLELPSLQYSEIDLGSWGTSSTSPLLESIEDFIQYDTLISTLESDCSSPQNSGLLDALLYPAKTLGSSKNNFYDKCSNSSIATPGDRADSSALNMYEP